MTRAVSTVLDVSLALLLVSAAAVTLVTLPGPDRRPPDPDAAARAVLASTANATYHAQAGGTRTVKGRVATLLGHAVLARERGSDPRFVRAVESAVERVLARTDRPTAVVAAIDRTSIRAGPRPPPSASAAAVTHPVVVANTTVLVTVRTWSA